MRHATTTIFLALFALVFTAQAEKPIEMNLWPDGAPGLPKDAKREIVDQEKPGDKFRRVVRVTEPKLTVYKPAADKDTGAAVLICPGGGYNILAVEHEGEEIADWLNTLGVTGVVLQYRVPRSKTQEKHEAPLQDAQRAMSLIRKHAQEWGIDPQRVGMMGFSAGGHLAATSGTNYKNRAYKPVDDADSASLRPDFLMLIYPAYLGMEKEGEPLTLSKELPVDSETPPTFLVHTGDDRVPATGSIAFYLALREAGVPAELHIYPSGGHGYGLRPSDHAVSTWPERSGVWLKSLGVLNK